MKVKFSLGDYIAYYLRNPEKPHLRWHFILFLVSLLGLAGLQQQLPLPTESKIIIGATVSILLLIAACYFGYLGLLVSLALNGLGFRTMAALWAVDGDRMNFVIMAFLISNTFAAVIIAHLTEGERFKQQRLEWLSVVDGLTELHNHRFFQQRLDEEEARAQRNKSCLGLIMADLDNFKRYNDTNGHQAGDNLLKQTAQMLRTVTRKPDVVCRYGGDEFAILLPETGLEEARTVARRVEEAFGCLTLPGLQNQPVGRMTMSMGLSAIPELANNKMALIAQADSALYHAKHLGRNNVQIFRDVFEEMRGNCQADEHLLIAGFKALLGTISAKDKYTLGHSERVSRYALSIGRALGQDPRQTELLLFAALLHDIGKVEIPEEILMKRGVLTEDEMQLMHRHPVFSANILEPLADINNLIAAVRHHHERYDGCGYPDAIAGSEIPIAARILAVADSYDAMRSDRPYRDGMGFDAAVRELEHCAGTQFDPKIVQVFVDQLAGNAEADREDMEDAAAGGD